MRRPAAEIEREAHRLAAKGHSLREIGRVVECSRHAVSDILVREQRPPDPSEWTPGPGRLTMAERVEIRAGLERDETYTTIARALGRSVSTVLREVKTNGGRGGYRAWAAHRRAAERVKPPKTTTLSHRPLARAVTELLKRWWSPEESSQHLRAEFAHDPMMQVSHEPIYVQGRGELRRELHRCLRSGRARPLRRLVAPPRRSGSREGQRRHPQGDPQAPERAAPLDHLGSRARRCRATSASRSTRADSQAPIDGVQGGADLTGGGAVALVGVGLDGGRQAALGVTTVCIEAEVLRRAPERGRTGYVPPRWRPCCVGHDVGGQLGETVVLADGTGRLGAGAGADVRAGYGGVQGHQGVR
ncbi:MAG: helix-turn-helix domain-containing protein [Acidimicrobiales bacterium]